MKSAKIGLELFVSILFVMLSLCLVVSSIYARNNKNIITFDNQSGEPALVKLVGPTGQTIEVPNGQSRKVNAAAGEYYILARYGSIPKHYRYSKGDPFTVRETETQYSAITITLHKVAGGNYPSRRSSREEFEEAATGVRTAKSDRNLYSKESKDRSADGIDRETVQHIQSLLSEMGYDPGPINGLFSPRTRAAIEKYQRSKGLPVTGDISQELLALLPETSGPKKPTKVIYYIRQGMGLKQVSPPPWGSCQLGYVYQEVLGRWSCATHRECFAGAPCSSVSSELPIICGSLMQNVKIVPLKSAAVKDVESWASDKNVKRLIVALSDPDASVREKTAWSLGRIGDKAAVEPLITALKDQDNWVRMKSARALELITNKDFGEDSVKWQKWWEENKEAFPRAK